MLSFSPWWRHVSATVGLVSPLFLGLGALLISLTFLRMRLDTNLWLFVDQGMQHTWAGVRKLHLYILGLVFRQGFSCVRTNFTTCAVQPVLYGAVTPRLQTGNWIGLRRWDSRHVLGPWWEWWFMQLDTCTHIPHVLLFEDIPRRWWDGGRTEGVLKLKLVPVCERFRKTQTFQPPLCPRSFSVCA